MIGNKRNVAISVSNPRNISAFGQKASGATDIIFIISIIKILMKIIMKIIKSLINSISSSPCCALQICPTKPH